jgi:hypothetical protein
MNTHKLRLCESQIQLLDLPIGSKLSIQLSNSRLDNYQAGLGKDSGYITITEDVYTLKLASLDEEIVQAYGFLQEQTNDGYRVMFSLSDRPFVWFHWGEIPWRWHQVNGVKSLRISNSTP